MARHPDTGVEMATRRRFSTPQFSDIGRAPILPDTRGRLNPNGSITPVADMSWLGSPPPKSPHFGSSNDLARGDNMMKSQAAGMEHVVHSMHQAKQGLDAGTHPTGLESKNPKVNAAMAASLQTGKRGGVFHTSASGTKVYESGGTGAGKSARPAPSVEGLGWGGLRGR